jgi:hypothetical protein
MTVATPAVQLFLSVQRDNHASMGNGQAIQILPNIQCLSRCSKHQFAAFIMNQGYLVVWDDEARHLISRAAELESLLLATIWNNDNVDDMTKKSGSVLVDTVPVLEPQNKNDLEAMVPESRSIILWSPTSVAATLALMCSAIGLGLRSLALETAVDGTYLRLALLVMLPIIFFMGLVSYFMSC